MPLQVTSVMQSDRKLVPSDHLRSSDGVELDYAIIALVADIPFKDDPRPRQRDDIESCRHASLSDAL